MTSVFYLYYFIDSWAGVVPVRRVSMHLVSSHFPIVSISASGSYFEKRRSKEQIFAHCCCWLIQPCGKRPRSTQMEPLGLNHSLSDEKKMEVSTAFGRFPALSVLARLYKIKNIEFRCSFVFNKVPFQNVKWLSHHHKWSGKASKASRHNIPQCSTFRKKRIRWLFLP